MAVTPEMFAFTAGLSDCSPRAAYERSAVIKLIGSAESPGLNMSCGSVMLLTLSFSTV